MHGRAISPPRFLKFCKRAIPPEFSEKKKMVEALGLEPLLTDAIESENKRNVLVTILVAIPTANRKLDVVTQDYT